MSRCTCLQSVPTLSLLRSSFVATVSTTLIVFHALLVSIVVTAASLRDPHYSSLAYSPCLSTHRLSRSSQTVDDKPMETKQLGLRALYTINGGPQYILALSPRKFPVTVIRLSSTNESDENVLYGRAMLKPFLEMICTGSPDVVQIQPGKKDFTVYVLDPLEVRHVSSAALFGSSSAPGSQPGVAIGLGLLSSALYDGDCDVTVAGTIMTDGIQEERLEVVFSLREYVPPENYVYLSTLRNSPSSPALPPQPSRSAYVNSKLPTKGSSSSRVSCSSSHTHPHPPRISSASATTTVSVSFRQDMQPSKSSYPPMIVSRESTGEVQPTLQSLLISLAGGSKTSELLGTLSAIDSSSHANPNLALIEALTKALYPTPSVSKVLSPSSQSTPTTAPTTLDRKSSSKQSNRTGSISDPQTSRPSVPSHARFVPISSPAKSERSDDDIVLLDKENVNPLAFRKRRGEKEKASDNIPISSAFPANSAQTAAQSQSKVAQHPIPLAPSSNGARKRTLSDIVEEKERERVRNRRRTQLASDPESQPVKRRSYYREHTGAMPEHAMSDSGLSKGSPPHRTADASAVPASSPSRHYDRTALLSDTQPVAGPSTVPALMASKKKPYVVPKWAQTETATVPRFAPGYGPRLPEPPADKLLRKKSGKKGSKKHVVDENGEHEDIEPSQSLSRKPSRSKLTRGSSPARRCSPSHTPASKPQDASPPVVANSNISILPSPIRASLNPPSTPRRRRHSIGNSPLGNSPLFTPVGKRRTPKTVSSKKLPSLYSILSPSYLRMRTSPPRQSLLTSKSATLDDDAQSSQDMVTPLESLPIASSDFGDSDAFGSTGPSQQHWSVGLPPSSPFPPSSPILSPESDNSTEDILGGENDFRVTFPKSTSNEETIEDKDSESQLNQVSSANADPFAFFSDSAVDPEAVSQLTDEELERLFRSTLPNISSLLTDGPDSSTSTVPTASSEQRSDMSFPSLSTPAIDSALSQGDDGLIDFDFDGLWASMGPLLDQNTVSLANSPTLDPSVLLEQAGQAIAIDAEKLAEDIHSLYSGCVL
ncbi:hypothetical protein BDY19DRAFT_1058274 [Irpex rosettiformis]|uniref:Uncharacterized protein n=1 Tax=Irpex rosettiformis TaxID=378272 RepID=A0ACB8TZL1_9APHY|nr:hypothetical protein BDY19DRAFT_1058274 [Irpex rosettiformis]